MYESGKKLELTFVFCDVFCGSSRRANAVSLLAAAEGWLMLAEIFP